MNYEAGLIAFVLFYVPIYFIYKEVKRNNEETEKEYDRRTKANWLG